VRAVLALAVAAALGLVAAPADARPFAGPAPQSASNQGGDFTTSRSVVMQAQTVLRDLGIYRGPINGQLTPSTRAAILELQDRNRLQRTSRLDFRAGDALHVYVRGYGPDARTDASDELNVMLQPDEWRGVSRIVVHGAGDTPVVVKSDRFVGRTGALSPQDAAALEERTASLLTDYSRQLRVRYDRRTGLLTMLRANYRENEIELLFALNVFATSGSIASASADVSLKSPNHTRKNTSP
jgi:peptidoglycan hydrolase-like protein with peptidoglycan-binding domain